MKKDILLIWDFDDTIVKTNVEFEKTNVEASKEIAKAIFGEEKNIEEIQTHHRKIDYELIPIYGFVPERYMESWIKAYEYFADVENAPVLESVKKNVLRIVKDVYTRQYEELPHAVDIVKELKEQGYRMMILTAGIDSIQKRRIKEAGIDHLMDDIQVRPDKTPETLQEVLKSNPAQEYIMIGNSLKSDIHPALENDIWGFHIERRTWSADEYSIDREHSRYVHMNSITEVPSKLRMIQNQMKLWV